MPEFNLVHAAAKRLQELACDVTVFAVISGDASSHVKEGSKGKRQSTGLRPFLRGLGYALRT